MRRLLVFLYPLLLMTTLCACAEAENEVQIKPVESAGSALSPMAYSVNVISPKIHSVSYDGSFAHISFVTNQESNVVIAIYDIDNHKMLDSSFAHVSLGQTETDIEIETTSNELEIRAFLVSGETWVPLCEKWSSDNPENPENNDEQYFRHIYESTVFALLSDDVWNDRDIQDASHFLMMPMHYAFMANWGSAIDKYTSFFNRFVDSVSSSDFDTLSRMKKMQFLYLGTEFLKLSVKYESETDEKLKEELFNLISEYANDDLLTIATWKTEPTVKEHLIQVLNHKVYVQSRYSLIVDGDFYTLACLCDLAYVSRCTGVPITEDMQFAVEYVATLFGDSEINTETEEGYWLFQVGVAKDYSDYAYAGNEFSYEGMEPKQRDDIVTDSSHFRRMPLWLLSYRDAQEDEGSVELFNQRISQLGKLLAEKVFRQNNGYWVTTTFIDGTNGVYRYDYHNDGNSIEGYDQAGGTLFLGYWIMLNNEKVRTVYHDIEAYLPLTADSSNPYHDEGITVREQHPIMDKDATWSNGMSETLIECICRIGEMLEEMKE